MPTDVNDVVLVHVNESPGFFARVEEITPDVKPDWWQVKLLVLQVPLKSVVWILRDAYIQGEIFTMGGTPIKIEKVVSPAGAGEESGQFEAEPELSSPDNDSSSPDAKSKATIISLDERRKK